MKRYDLLSTRVYAEVLANEVGVFPPLRELARKVVLVLVDEMGEDDKPDGFSITVGDLTSKVGEDVTPRFMGEVLDSMGLRCRVRRRDGIHLLWARKQVDILMEALGLADDEVASVSVVMRVPAGDELSLVSSLD